MSSGLLCWVLQRRGQIQHSLLCLCLTVTSELASMAALPARLHFDEHGDLMIPDEVNRKDWLLDLPSIIGMAHYRAGISADSGAESASESAVESALLQLLWLLLLTTWRAPRSVGTLKLISITTCSPLLILQLSPRRMAAQ